jgi:hypothetical protein
MFCMGTAIWRATASNPPPGLLGTIRSMGLDGKPATVIGAWVADAAAAEGEGDGTAEPAGFAAGEAAGEAPPAAAGEAGAVVGLGAAVGAAGAAGVQAARTARLAVPRAAFRNARRLG